MTTSKKRKRSAHTGIYFNGERIIYQGHDDKLTVPKDKDPLAFVVPWQLSDNRKDR